MQDVIIVCGVPGSGKTFVCRKLAHKLHYIPHDEHFKNHLEVIIKAAKTADKKIITEIPFMERAIRADLEKAGIKVYPYFVIESPETVKKRYEEREGKEIPKQNLTRAISILQRAKEWRAPYGKSDLIFRMLDAQF